MKRFFLKRAPRERLLILLFLGLAAVLWLGSAGRRVHDRWTARREVAAELATQQLWLERKSAIEERAARAAGRLDPASTLDATRLVGEVVALAAEAGLSASMDAPRTQRTGQFAYHTVQVAFRRAELGAVVKFYRALARRAPYLALEESSFIANRNNPAELDARFAVFSVEVVR